MEALKEKFIPKYLSIGDPKFYKFLINYAVNKLTQLNHDEALEISPELEFLNYHDKFMVLYRREGEEVYLEIAKVFRKAAHKIYRVMLKKQLTQQNTKFLHLI